MTTGALGAAKAAPTPVRQSEYCLRGIHEMTPDNVTVRHSGRGLYRMCNTCRRERDRIRQGRTGEPVVWIDSAPFVEWFDRQVALLASAAGMDYKRIGAPAQVANRCGWKSLTGTRRVLRWKAGEHASLAIVEAALHHADVPLESVYPDLCPQDPGPVFDRWCYHCADLGHDGMVTTSTTLICPWCETTEFRHITGPYPPKEVLMVRGRRLAQRDLAIGVKLIHRRSGERAVIRQVFRVDRRAIIRYEDPTAQPTTTYLFFTDLVRAFWGEP